MKYWINLFLFLFCISFTNAQSDDFQNSAVFNGTDGYIEIADNPSLNDYQDGLTIQMWINSECEHYTYASLINKASC